MSGAGETTATGPIDLWSARALRDLLECDVELDEGAPLPVLWHWVHLLDHAPQSALGEDGHRRRTGPDVGLRRMWAGGEVTQHGPLRIGEEATRISREISRETKRGSVGEFTLVSIGHQLHQRGEVVVDEVQRLVYRPPAPMGGAVGEGTGGPDGAVKSPAAQPVASGERAWPVDEVVLFRYSALTYNGHRIHYDRPYATGVEGYPGLLVHGPLQALLMAEHAAAQHNPARAPARIDYRLVSPLFDGQGCVTGTEASGSGSDGESGGGLEGRVTGDVTTYLRDETGRRTATATYGLI